MQKSVFSVGIVVPVPYLSWLHESWDFTGGPSCLLRGAGIFAVASLTGMSSSMCFCLDTQPWADRLSSPGLSETSLSQTQICFFHPLCHWCVLCPDHQTTPRCLPLFLHNLTLQMLNIALNLPRFLWVLISLTSLVKFSKADGTPGPPSSLLCRLNSYLLYWPLYCAVEWQLKCPSFSQMFGPLTVSPPALLL